MKAKLGALYVYSASTVLSGAPLMPSLARRWCAQRADTCLGSSKSYHSPSVSTNRLCHSLGAMGGHLNPCSGIFVERSTNNASLDWKLVVNCTMRRTFDHHATYRFSQSRPICLGWLVVEPGLVHVRI